MNKLKQIHPPDTLLILGTDAAGKNHVANFIADVLEKSGYAVEKRDGWFSNKAEDIVSSEDKGYFSLLKEQVFLTVFPLMKFIIPVLLTILIKADLKKFRKTDKNIIVISHTAIRILAFYLGHVYKKEEDIRLPQYLDKALQAIAPITQAAAIVLDIDDAIRQDRIAKRLMSGNADNFDRYMAKDSIRSERIENFLVWLGTTYLNAVKIENNDLNDDELFVQICRVFELCNK